jgi:hypothetical protein
MQIILTPNDIIERCIWDKYRKFVLHNKTENELKKIIEDNNPVTISENDAYVVGLLKIIETDNLIHRFNENIVEVLQIKSNIINDDLFINKNVIMKELSTYMNKFPDYYKPSFNYKNAIDELRKYVSEVEENVNNLNILTTKQKEKIFNFINSKEVRKCLIF